MEQTATDGNRATHSQGSLPDDEPGRGRAEGQNNEQQHRHQHGGAGGGAAGGRARGAGAEGRLQRRPAHALQRAVLCFRALPAVLARAYPRQRSFHFHGCNGKVARDQSSVRRLARESGRGAAEERYRPASQVSSWVTRLGGGCWSGQAQRWPAGTSRHKWLQAAREHAPRDPARDALYRSGWYTGHNLVFHELVDEAGNRCLTSFLPFTAEGLTRSLEIMNGTPLPNLSWRTSSPVSRVTQ